MNGRFFFLKRTIEKRKLPGTIIEVASPKPFSGTGRASACRCRDLFPSRRFLFKISLGWILFFSFSNLFAPFNLSLTSKSVETDTYTTVLTVGASSFTLKLPAILMGRPSHRLPSKSRPATHGSSLLDLDPPTKRFAWMRLDRSSALTSEPMKNTITDLSTHSSSLAALVRPDLVPRKLTAVLQPPSAKMGGAANAWKVENIIYGAMEMLSGGTQIVWAGPVEQLGVLGKKM
ncbi:uncharacterized protein LOC110230221 isoform X1 [Arabidopsis lyrata subsp. lyrata]|uniref:uncharacterized protein LOC110230221 isoform X1 n=1 Tax=Arabidopsis lyrata subsp. lyrata TaxID=81972 RepID=UPI000A29D052|nr:uncharacterized protein LOC110230221 isoform X1 [Arabidopsis lyrata subsp. lyrata]|eukprot:XP_020888003.1 uncharacterized protein LOC110230221 isoform X1 [Arabidopsis lyrata subsp. lyrata]